MAAPSSSCMTIAIVLVCGSSILARPRPSLMARSWIIVGPGRRATVRTAICWGWTISLASWPAWLRDEAGPFPPQLGPAGQTDVDLWLRPHYACRQETGTPLGGQFTWSCRTRCHPLRGYTTNARSWPPHKPVSQSSMTLIYRRGRKQWASPQLFSSGFTPL